MRPSVRNTALFVLLALPLGACARCAPGQVASGVGRLTMLNMGTLVEILNDENSPCSFESEAAKASLRLSGPEGAMGTGTWRIEECVLEFPKSDPYISEDCNGVITQATGRVKVTAERSISGVIAGDEDNPVIPGGPDGVTINVIKADFSNFRVSTSSGENALTWTSGSISGSLSPRLAVDNDLGACSVVTSNAFISDVKYARNSAVYVETADRSFDVDVDDSDLSAVNGIHSGRENEIWGTIQVWGGEHSVPDDGDGLDPDYNPDRFPLSYQCKEDLAQPARYDCEGFLGPVLAQNTARISMLLIGRVVTVLEADTTCGFSNPDVLRNGVVEGEVGGIGAATYRVEKCVLEYAEPTVATEDCEGNPSIIQGRLVVSGTMRLEGRLTGDLETPVVPMTDNAAIFDVDIEQFDGFEVRESSNAIVVHDGGMTGRVEPRLAANSEDSGACSYVSDIVRFSDVAWRPSFITLSADDGTFNASVQQSNLRAVNGYWNGDVNMLRGSIVLDDEPYQLPTDPDDDGLNPDFERTAFDDAWQCAPLELPARFDCAFETPLAQGAAQLGVQTFGMVATLIEADERCGFSSPTVLDEVKIDGVVGLDDGRAVYEIEDPCTLVYPEPTVVDTDCNGVRTWVQGLARVRGTFTLAGIASGDPVEPIVPTSRDPASLRLTSTFQDFAVWTDPGDNILTIKSGRMTGTVAPRVGVDDSTLACSITTPVARIRDLRYSLADVTVEQEGKKFDLNISRSVLDATNGQTETATNELTGTLTMDGTTYDIPAEGEAILNPDFDPVTFERSYACTENLTIAREEAQCNMKQAIGEGVARLLMLAAGTQASTVFVNDDCGFEDFFVQVSPDIVEGENGGRGRLRWTIEDCEIRGTSSRPDATDCNGIESYQDGRYVLDARLTVVGRRDTELVIFDSIIPDNPNSVTIELLDAELNNYRLYSVRPGETEPYQGIEIERARIAGIVEPITGENRENRGHYDIATPVARLTAVRLLEGAHVTIFSEGKTFTAYIDSAQLEGFNGSYVGLGLTNYLQGQIVVDGYPVTIDAVLDPSFEQTTFDQSYRCTENLAALIPPVP